MKRDCAYLLYLLLAFFCVLLLNVFCLEIYDGLCYAFIKDAGGVRRCKSILDVFNQQYYCYFVSNGRVVVHGIVAAFTGWRLYFLFDFLNTVVWFIFVGLMLKAGEIQILSAHNFTVGFAVVFAFCWYAEATCRDAAFALNYLWPMTLTIAVLLYWGRLKRIRFLPLLFMYGWTQECSVLPAACALVGNELYVCVMQRKLPTVRTVLAILSVLAGAAFLTMGPASRGRAGLALSVSLGHKIVIMCKGLAILCCSLWPIILLCALFYVLICNRSRIQEFFQEHLIWLIFTAASFALFLLNSNAGVFRIAFPFLSGATIILIRNAALFGRFKRFEFGLIVYSLVFMVGATFVQYELARDNLEMIRRYVADSKGETYREERMRFPFYFSTDTPRFWPTHYQAIQNEFSPGKPIVVLTKKEWHARHNKDCVASSARYQFIPRSMRAFFGIFNELHYDPKE